MLTERIRRGIDDHELMPPGSRVLVGVSGGVDSVVLLHVLRRLAFDVVAAHVNYGLRGDASDADEAFVRTLCEDWEVPLHVCTSDAVREEPARSLQETARDVRYAYFGAVADASGVPFVAVAHHRDDQVETVLLHLVRGSGPEGLAGMPPSRPLRDGSAVRLVRPLLDEPREALTAYAREEGLTWCEDASNRSSAYRRNRIRSDVMPFLESRFGEGTPAAIARSSRLLRAYVDATLRPELDRLFAVVARSHVRGGALDLRALQALEPVWQGRLVLEALRRWLPDAPRRASFVRAVRSLSGSQTGRRIETSGGAVWRERDGLFFAVASGIPADWERSLEVGATVALPGGGVLHLALCEAPPEHPDAGSPDRVYVDLDQLQAPLGVRPWRAGDRIRPLGLSGTKKVSDLLTEARIPSHRRAQALVVCSGRTIVWVVGVRLSEVVRVRPGSRLVATIGYDRPPAD